MHAGHCHCDNCRRAQGAGVWAWVTFATKQVRVTRGEAELSTYVSEAASTRRFCRICGSTLIYESPRWPGTTDLSLANILDPIDVPLSRHNYADRAPDWSPILDDLPQLGGPDGCTPL